MKKHYIALSLIALASLTSCFNDSTSKTSTKDSTSINSNESKKTNSDKTSPVEPVTPPTIDDKEFSFLLGDYYGKNAKVTIGNSSLTLTGKTELSLNASKVETIELEYSKTDEDEETKTYDTLKIEFSSEYNNGIDYQAYINFDDGFLHLEKVENDSTVTTIGTYMPDIKEFSGSYSAYGDSSQYNMYFSFSGDFDLERGVFPSSHKSAYSISSEQSWYLESYYVCVNDTIYKAIQEFDQDKYGYGKNIIYKNTEKNDIYVFSGTNEYSVDYDFFEYVTDIGVLQNLNLFDGENKVTLNVNVEDNTITFGTLSGTYTKVVDDEGLKVKAVFGDKNYIFSFGERYIIVNDGNSEKVYPVNDIDDLYGVFTDGTNTFKIEEQYDESYEVTDPKVYLNDAEISYKYVTSNNRKSIQIVKDGITYIISPDNTGSSIRLDTNGVISYPIYESKFKDLYTDTFVSHDKSTSFSFTITSDMKYEFTGEKDNVKFKYWHGDKYPSISFKYKEKDYSLELIQEDIGYYELITDEATYTLYSQTVLNSVFGEYSSNYNDSFVLTPSLLIKDGVSYPYSFAPYFVESSGLYNFGILTDEEDGHYQNNLYGTFINSTTSYVKKSVFEGIKGTYQAYGKYGIENIKFTEDGKLLLDVVNSTNDGLERNVETNYLIYTDTNNTPIIVFNYGKVNISISFYGNYVEIATLKYYNSCLVNTWGTYISSDNTNTLFIQDDSVYLNGTKLSISSYEYSDDKAIFYSDDYTITYYNGSDNVTLDSETSCVKLSRKLSFTDFDKFVGTYTINGSEVVISKSTTIGYSITTAGSTVSTYYIARHNDKLALTFSDFNGTYYLMLNEETGEITTDFEASSIPVPPPLPF